ncbi:MAG: hypothetical protein ABIO92_09365 [Chloroflexia bacterium]
MLDLSLQPESYTRTVQPENTGLASGASVRIACEYGNSYYWWHYSVLTNRCHAPG